MVSSTHISIPHHTSYIVWPSLSFSMFIFLPTFNMSFSSILISFSSCACFHASSLTFTLSYRIRDHTATANAKSVEFGHCIMYTSVHILHSSALWTEGNHQDLQR